jgi:hypothetical protein
MAQNQLKKIAHTWRVGASVPCRAVAFRGHGHCQLHLVGMAAENHPPDASLPTRWLTILKSQQWPDGRWRILTHRHRSNRMTSKSPPLRSGRCKSTGQKRSARITIWP